MQWSVAALLLVIASASLAVPTDDPARSTFYKPTDDARASYSPSAPPRPPPLSGSRHHNKLHGQTINGDDKWTPTNLPFTDTVDLMDHPSHLPEEMRPGLTHHRPTAPTQMMETATFPYPPKRGLMKEVSPVFEEEEDQNIGRVKESSRSSTAKVIPTTTAATQTKSLETSTGKKMMTSTTILSIKAVPTTQAPDVTSQTDGQGLDLGDVRPASGGDLQVELPPQITWPLSQEILVVKTQPGQPFTQHCKATGQPPPSYQWFRNGNRVLPSGLYVQAFENGTIHFPRFTDNDDGMFQCKASNMYGTSVSVLKPILMKRDPRTPPDSHTDEIRYPTAWSPYSLPCDNIPDTLPASKKRWYLGPKQNETRTSTRVGMDSQGTLHFAYLEVADSNAYICGLIPEVLDNGYIKLYKKGSLAVQDAREETLAPVEQYVSREVKATIGQETILDCFFGGNPIPEILWQNVSNHEIRGDDSLYEIRNYGRQLLVKHVREEDEGEFKCTAKNLMGETQIEIRLNATAPPRRVAYKGLTTLTRPDHSDVTLHCSGSPARGERAETPLWYRNGGRLEKANLPDPSRYKFSPDFTQLHIKDLNKKEDMACFQCNISNSEGYLFMDGYLRVIDSIQIVQRPADEVKVTEDQVKMVDLSVKAKGDSCCEINKFWRHNGTELRLADMRKPPYIYNDETGDLFFNASSVAKETLYRKLGRYSVRVSNAHQKVDVGFVISLTVDPSAATAGDEGGFKLWWLAIVFGILAIIIAIVVVIVIMRSNYPRDTYMLEKTELQHQLNPEKDLLDQSFQEI